MSRAVVVTAGEVKYIQDIAVGCKRRWMRRCQQPEVNYRGSSDELGDFPGPNAEVLFHVERNTCH